MSTGIVIGAGDRGQNAYAPYLLEHPDAGRIVAVAEPVAARRERFARRFGLAPDACADDGLALLARPRLGEFAIVATGDALHVEPALHALEAGYHVLLEKPMALDEAGCLALVEAAERTGRILQICHVLRYAPLFARLHALAASGALGRIVTIQHSENVSHWHYAHSYCRGIFRQRSVAPMLLAKSCHDLDLLYWLAGAEPRRIHSFRRETELCERNAPPDAPLHCIEGCPHSETCPYDAVATYREMTPLLRDLALTREPRWLGAGADLAARTLPPLRALGPRVREALAWKGWPTSVISEDPSPAAVDEVLRTTRWGRCVYRVGDNDQPSSQVVDIEFANDVVASFTMHTTSHREGREIRVDGTRGSAVGRFYLGEQRLEVVDHKSGHRRREPLPRSTGGHGGGDHRLFAGFLAAIRGDAEPLTTARESLQSHRMAFAAERSADEGVVVPL